MTTDSAGAHRSKGPAAPAQIAVAASTVFLMYLGLMVVNPLIAPLSRELELAEWQIGAVVSAAALIMVGTSPAWGRYGGVWGRRRVLLAMTASATAALTVFAVFAQLGLDKAITPTAVFIGFLVARGFWFGLSEAAVMPNLQAYIAESTTGEAARVRGMAALGAANSLALIVGAALGGLLASAGTLVPLWVTPLLVLAAAVLVAVRFHPAASTAVTGKAAVRVKVLDKRIFPFLAIAFCTFTALGFMQILIGFLIQDRLDTAPSQTALLTGIALVAAGGGLIISQAFIVPKSDWRPSVLIRFGLTVALVGFLALLPSWGYAGLLSGVTLTALGFGMVGPSINVGVSLAVRNTEQGSVAGLVGAAIALTFVVSPVAATALYSASEHTPLVIAALACAVALGLAWAAPLLRGSPAAAHDAE